MVLTEKREVLLRTGGNLPGMDSRLGGRLSLAPLFVYYYCVFRICWFYLSAVVLRQNCLDFSFLPCVPIDVSRGNCNSEPHAESCFVPCMEDTCTGFLGGCRFFMVEKGETDSGLFRSSTISILLFRGNVERHSMGCSPCL